ncbi:tetraacyldisaccharide 4'-kinase [Parabacteroides pacaensis]|uniref:tetraacyldisaccharide 4'-kinase n=1 Tax=Parabacteroides pacaensis TaxID=2086575 RepID=UPI000D10ECE5|nr:tetraacyldisaccharide 4'-kinase [Parabacteroides pacaensis]
MFENIPIKTYPLLHPISFLYGIGVRFRNQLFNWGILPSAQYPVPVICIGNLTVGGTGKTPLTEYLIHFLSDHYRVAIISRGYKRKTTGFILATSQSTSKEIGDEPLQIKRKFPSLSVAVDSNRRRAINTLLNLPENERPEVILLDDAFQHRYVLPSLSILLTDYRRRFYLDSLLPVGRLREPKCGKRRANIILITKCDPDLKPIEYRVLESEVEPMVHQSVFFTGITYGELTPIFQTFQREKKLLKDISKEDEILLVSGIATPEPLIDKIKQYSEKVAIMNFPDHYMFKSKDIKKIKSEFDKLSSLNKMIIVTEKDAMRLIDNTIIENDLKPYFYYLPITIDFRQNQEKEFQEAIINHILTVHRNRILR